jgi:hypothetical protein
MIKRPATLGELRNAALDLVESEFQISWDDDDWHGPERIQIQAAACQGSASASILACYTTVDLVTGEAFVRSCKSFSCGGCEGTILHRRTTHRYPACERGEDTAFAQAFLDDGSLVVVESDPLVYVRTYHGHNVSGKRHIIDRARRSGRPLTARQLSELQPILAAYGDAAR